MPGDMISTHVDVDDLSKLGRRALVETSVSFYAGTGDANRCRENKKLSAMLPMPVARATHQDRR